MAIYSKREDEDFDYKTLRAEKGSLVSVVIGVVVAGIIQGAVSQMYYVKTTKYTVKARDNKTNSEQFINAEIFKVALKGGGYSSKDYYEGYRPWNDDIVAYQWFLDFWNYLYQGVRGYY